MISRREVLALIPASAAVSVAMNWRILGAFGSAVPSSPRDPLLELWSFAWGAHALVHDPWRFFDANIFWPLGDTLAFSDSLAGYAPVGLLGSGPGAALVQYNLLFLFTYALAAAAAYLLARELGASPAGAAVAGCAFAWAPWRAAQMPHLHVLSSGGIPLSLFLFLRGWRRRSPAAAAAGWAVAAWQISLGWNLGLPFLYLLTAGSLVLAAALALRRVALPPRPVLVAFVAGGLACGVLAVAFSVPYVRVLHRHPEARRTADTLFYFSPPPRGFLAAPKESLVWGSATRSVRRRLPASNEQELFPGVAIVLLALGGLAAGRFPLRLRVGLALAAVAGAVFSLGFGFHGGLLGYRFLFNHAPGWQGLRTPGRLAAFTALALALLAAAGADRLVALVRRRGLAPLAGATIALLVLVEGYGRMTLFTPPPVPPGTAALASPRLYLPFAFNFNDDIYVYWSTRGFPRIVNGWSGFAPGSYVRLSRELRGFPDPSSVAALRRLGVRSVILDPALARGTAWSGAAAKPVAGLGLSRRQVGDVIVFAP